MTDVHGTVLDQGRVQVPGQCMDRVFIEAKTLKETKSIILITARDISKCSKLTIISTSSIV